MKRILCFVLAVIIVSLCLSVTAFAESPGAFEGGVILPLRAGGGGGGGSSHHSSSGRTPDELTVWDYILMPFIVFSSTIVFYIKLTARSRKSKKLMKTMMQSDSAWKYESISSTVNDSFYAIQNAWSNLDMTPATQYMSDELFENFQSQLSWMAYRNEQNVLKNIKLLHALPVAVYDDPDNSKDHIWFFVKGRMIDYKINTDTGRVVEGKLTPSSFIEYWCFIRREDKWVLDKILQKNEAHKIEYNK